MKVLFLHTNPFDLGKHLLDEHELNALTVGCMDSDELRRAHVVLHERLRRNRSHIHTDDPDLANTSVTFD